MMISQNKIQELILHMDLNFFTTIVIEPEKYSEISVELAKELSKYHNKILYVNMNKMVQNIKKNLIKQEVDLNKFIFIDGVTKSMVPNIIDDEDCVYISSPAELSEIRVTVTKLYQLHNYDCVFFDCISALLIYNSNSSVSMFLESLADKIKVFGIKCILIIPKKEQELKIIANIPFLKDSVFHLE